MNSGSFHALELEAEPGELIVPVADLRRILQMQEDKLAGLPSSQDVEGFNEWSREEDAEKLHRLAIVSVGRRNGKELTARIAQIGAVAGLDAEEFDEALRRVGELVSQAAAAAAEMLDAVIQAVNDVYAPALAEAWEEIQKIMEEYADVDEPEEEDRHDGAVVVLVAWLPMAPTLYELYGQGVDHGGPGPSRLTLIRVTDDGLRRAETGNKQERRQQNEETQGLQHGRSC